MEVCTTRDSDSRSTLGSCGMFTIVHDRADVGQLSERPGPGRVRQAENVMTYCLCTHRATTLHLSLLVEPVFLCFCSTHRFDCSTTYMFSRLLVRRLHPSFDTTLFSERINLTLLSNQSSYKLTSLSPIGVRSCSQSRSQIKLFHTQQSVIGLSATTLIFCGCLLSGSIVLYRKSQNQSYPAAAGELKEPEETAESGAMVGSLPPGRPGNLTVEQEAKLQEFWKATLKVFGVPDLGGIDGGGSVNGSVNGDVEDDPSEHASTLNPEKKSKRKGLFRRKKGDSGDKDDVSVHSSIPDADDKYGQTKVFQQVLATQSPQDLRDAFWSMVKHDHPDGLLLRFLRARKWDVEKALVMMVSTMQWRSHEMHVDDDIMYNGEAAAYKDAIESTGPTKKEGEDFMKIMRLGKSFLHGCDKEGRPICVVRARLHRVGEQSEASLERVTVHIIETARLLLSPPVDSAVNLLLPRVSIYANRYGRQLCST